MSGFLEVFAAPLVLFILKVLVIVIAVLICTIVPIAFIRGSDKPSKDGKKLKVENLKKKYDAHIKRFFEKTLGKKELKAYFKNLKKKDKEKGDKKSKPSLYVLEFKGDVKASQVAQLRDEISVILSVAKEKDEVALLLRISWRSCAWLRTGWDTTSKNKRQKTSS